MPASGTLTQAASLPADARASRAASREAPGLRSALDPTTAAHALERALPPRAGIRVVGCRIEHACYLPGEGAAVRYRLELADPAGATVAVRVTGRLYASPGAAAAYARDVLAPLAARAGARRELAPLSAPVGLADALAMAVSAYPIDGRLPALVDATDPGRMARVIGPLAGRPGAACAVALVRHRGGTRCLLRYVIERDGPAETVFGKLAPDARGRIADHALRQLAGVRADFDVPRSLGHLPELGLLLLAAAPGAPEVSRALKRFTHGEPVPVGELERGLEACAAVAAALHRAPVAGLPARSAAQELRGLRRRVADVRPAAGGLVATLEAALDRAERRLDATPALDAGTCHGDFKHNQLLLTGGRPTLVDLDAACAAEPALDLGAFLAYLWLKLTGEDAPAPAWAADLLSDRFLRAYVDAAPRSLEPAVAIDRAGAYAELCMVQRALHSWQKLKPERLAQALAYLEEPPR